MMWVFIAFCLFVGSLFFRDQKLPMSVVERLVDEYAPTNLVVHVDSVAFGFAHGLWICGLKVYDTTDNNAISPVLAAKTVGIRPLSRRVAIDGLKYSRLPSGYYAPGNHEKNARVETELPDVERISLTLTNSEVLGVRPEKLIADLSIASNRFTADRIHLDWPDTDEKMWLDGFCYVDLVRQEIYGEVEGSARQHHIRPLLVALDVPVSLPYFDGFTEVPGKVPSWCAWKVNLVNNDFDLYLKLHPTMGRYNSVPMKKADGDIHLHVYTRDDHLNYRQTIGPIVGVGPKDESLKGMVIVSGTNGYNVVDVDATSTLPVADILKIGGFTGEYVDRTVYGNATGKLQFRFPRAMTNNYEVLQGEGHVSIKDGQIMRAKGFRGLVALLAEKVPGVSWFTDSTQASCDYKIENGVIKTDNIYIEGSVFSIKMYGQFDSVRNDLDFIARVQFTKKDSWAGKVLHPLTWPFTKLLLEFKLTGTSEEPKWEYLSVIDRVVDVIK